MFALWVWVGDGTSKTFFSCSITLKMLSQVHLDPRSPNLYLDFKQLDGNGTKKVIKHTNGHQCQVGSTIEKRVLENQKKYVSGPITLKILSQVRLDPRSLNLYLDFKQLDGKGVKKVIKHTNRNECQVVSTSEKKSLKIQKIFISGPIIMKMLSQVRLGQRSLNLCLDLKQLDGKGVKKLIKHTNRHEMLGRQQNFKKVSQNFFFFFHF